MTQCCFVVCKNLNTSGSGTITKKPLPQSIRITHNENQLIVGFNFNQIEPYPQLRHNFKMAALFGGQCTEILWRG